MNCTRIEKRLFPYLDGRLREAERRKVEAHLAECTACRLRAEEFRAVGGLLEELPRIEPSGAFDLRVRARVAAEPQGRNWWVWLRPSPRVAFAASLLLMLVVWTASRRTDVDTYPHGTPATAANVAGQDEDFQAIKDLPVLEDYDVLSNFELLPDLPQEQPEQNSKM